ncbi:MAG: transcription-repair coupling factor [Armatimonadetes bacterium]|nr:transcription-repair coupling factor [Armatimonadota bacterium]
MSALDKWAELRQIQEGLSESASRVRVEGATPPVKALTAAAVARALSRTLFVISPTSETADRLYDHFVALTKDGGAPQQQRVVLLPSLEGLLYEDVPPDGTLVGERLHALRLLSDPSPRIFVASAPAALQRCLPPQALRPAEVTVAIRQSVDRDDLAERLIALGYERESLVESSGQMSVRGGIVDVYPAGAADPVRIEMFGEEVESIRSFDISTQRSQEDLESISMLPAREVLLSQDVIDRAAPEIEASAKKQVEALREEGKDAEADRLETRMSEVLEGLKLRSYERGLEYFTPFLYPEATTAIDYLPDDAIVVVDEPGRLADEYEQFQQDLLELQLARLDQGVLLPLPAPLHVPLKQVRPALARRSVLEISLFESAPDGEASARVTVSSQPMDEFLGDIPRLAMNLARWQTEGHRILIATRQGDRLVELLDEAELGAMVRDEPGVVPQGGEIVISHRPLNEGFKLAEAGLVALTDREVFGWRRVRRPLRRRTAEGAPIGSLTDLKIGDYVVHINHGVGIYRGLVNRGPSDAQREYLLVEYADEDKLYVPAEQFDRVQKYLGGEEERPAVHRLGGSEWERAKRRAKKSAQKMAGELIRLYAARHRESGHAFAADTPWQHEMEDGFEYEETRDQMGAISAVKEDMEEAKPMDRLVCGDVGYGKTEVAIRAAFKAVMGGKQVAVLVPTTVLAQQHYTTFRERLSPYPVRIEMLSRFRSKKEQVAVVEGLKAGSVDIVVGTHRLLSKDIEFKHLALVVVDEEQRFGVRHKEKLKKLRTTVDVITMTATPIPRTLHMALSGIRDMSVINDPPEGRTAVITRAMPREDGIMREAIMRELERGGQVYVVHNRVESISHVAQHIKELVPQARVVVGHGQMNERQLENTMMQFYAGEAQVLVCTTIIENGLDVSNANTLIVTDADRLGLAQLYQLRGRVGRSNRQAYAYLMWTPHKRLTETAEKRIQAIREFSQLGSGFKIALRDLEIRGAGNILGAEQHGFIASVGFELYMQMLSEAVQQAKGETPAPRPEVSIDLPVTAYLPEEYAPDRNQRIDLYRRLADAPDDTRLHQLAEEITDRFGRPLPEPVENLLSLAKVKIRCARAGVRRIAMEGNLAALLLTEDRRLSDQMVRKLRMALSPETRIWMALVGHDRAVVSLRKASKEQIFERLYAVLEALAQLPLEKEARRHQKREELAAGR